MSKQVNISGTALMVATVGILVGGGTALQLGSTSGSIATVWMFLQVFCTVFGTLTVGGLIADRRENKLLTAQQETHKKNLKRIARKYNEVTNMLESEFHTEKRSLGFFDKWGEERVRKHYEQLYLQNKRGFEQECRTLTTGSSTDSPTSRKYKRFWKTLIIAGVICQVIACGYTLGTASALEDIPQASVTRTNSTAETTEWNAENIPMYHLTDGSRYVSNPDQVVSANTERLLNQMLKKMDDSLQIESAMIIVNHVEGQDIFNFAQTIFDRYKVGKNDRGLVIVLAYQDHKVRTHTGRALEADLTDIECSRLQQTYAIPCMKAERPDSGMLYLTEAIYNTLKGKDLPMMESQRKEAEAEEASGVLGIYMLLFVFWALLIIYLYHRYNLSNGKNMLRTNPFVKAPVVVFGGGGFGGGGGGGFGGGGFSGGGFSGGSSGGGGATSSW